MSDIKFDHVQDGMMDHLNDNTAVGETSEFISVTIGRQLFGLRIDEVHDVFCPQAMTPVPLSRPEIAGVLNLRGRIVTAIDMRERLGLPPREKDATPMAVGIDQNGESYGLIIDEVGEVLRLSNSGLEPPPSNLDSRWREIAAGVYRLEGQLLVVLELAHVLAFDDRFRAA